MKVNIKYKDGNYIVNDLIMDHYPMLIESDFDGGIFGMLDENNELVVTTEETYINHVGEDTYISAIPRRSYNEADPISYRAMGVYIDDFDFITGEVNNQIGTPRNRMRVFYSIEHNCVFTMEYVKSNDGKSYIGLRFTLNTPQETIEKIAEELPSKMVLRYEVKGEKYFDSVLNLLRYTTKRKCD